MFFTGLVMDLTLTWSTCTLLLFLQEKKKKRGTNMQFLRKIKIRHSSVLRFEIRHPGYLFAQRTTSYQLLQLLSKRVALLYFFLNSAEPHLFCCSGMGPDFRVLVRRRRKQAEQNHILYITHLQDFDTMKVVFKKYLSFLYAEVI